MVKVVSLEKRLFQNKSVADSRRILYYFPSNQKYALDFMCLYEGGSNWLEFASIEIESVMNKVSSLIKGGSIDNFIGKDILYPWTEDVCDLTDDCVEVIDSNDIVFPYYLNELDLRPCEAVESLFDYVIRSFILYHREQKHPELISFTPVKDVQRRAMKNNQQNLLEVLRYMPRLSKFNDDKVKFE